MPRQPSPVRPLRPCVGVLVLDDGSCAHASSPVFSRATFHQHSSASLPRYAARRLLIFTTTAIGPTYTNDTVNARLGARGPRPASLSPFPPPSAPAPSHSRPRSSENPSERTVAVRSPPGPFTASSTRAHRRRRLRWRATRATRREHVRPKVATRLDSRLASCVVPEPRARPPRAFLKLRTRVRVCCSLARRWTDTARHGRRGAPAAGTASAAAGLGSERWDRQPHADGVHSSRPTNTQFCSSPERRDDRARETWSVARGRAP